MSHSKERHEKICLNCDAELSGRFCHVCGQENIEPKESVWGLIHHFFADITHFDGKFFSTTRLLVTKPGFLPAEYIKGRRARYLHPIRMYVFSSALFFLIFFTMFKPKEWVNGDWGSAGTKVRDSAVQLDMAREIVLRTAAHSAEDSATIRKSFADAKANFLARRSKGQAAVDSAVRAIDSLLAADSNAVTAVVRKRLKKERRQWLRELNEDEEDVRFNWFDQTNKYKTIAAYDSAQQALPPDMRDGWWSRKVKHRNIALSTRYEGKQKEFVQDLLDKFTHMFPYLLFISLPLYALFMKLLYYRHKQFYYVDHGIFFIYLYIFTFIFLLVYFSVMELRQATHQSWIGWLELLLLLAGTYYTYKAMRKFYGQSRGMTLLKFFLLNVLAFFTIILLFVFFGTLTIFQV